MFSGIVETVGTIEKVEAEGSNLHFTIQAAISGESYIDQSIAHNGACLTVVAKTDNSHTVTAIKESIIKTNMKDWVVGTKLNLERCITAEQRIDGHFVQGHVDDIGKVEAIKVEDGSWYYTISFDPKHKTLLVPKGSICINGVSLTLIDPEASRFSVAIIPYTHEHTNFHALQVGDVVNLEFDILGKYIQRHLQFQDG